MKRTAWLQETRKMRFEEAYGDGQGGRLSQEEAARVLGTGDPHQRPAIARPCWSQSPPA